eukprot:Sdes_comp20558_c0_seq1m15362
MKNISRIDTCLLRSEKKDYHTSRDNKNWVKNSQPIAGTATNATSSFFAAHIRKKLIPTQQDISEFFEDCRQDGKQLTVRAVLVGIFVGTLLCFSNMYFGLQTGWITMGSLPSTLLGFAFFKFMSKTGIRCFQGFSAHENVVLQTVAVATATMPLAGGFVGIMIALEQIPEAQHLHLNTWSFILWSFSIAFFGLFFAVPLRRQTILIEKLQFPSGTATATMIRALHSHPFVSLEDVCESPGWESVWYLLLFSFGISSFYVMSSYFFPFLQSLPLLAWTGTGFGWVATSWGWTFKPSFSYIGQGMIMGPKVGYSALIGSFLGWAFLGPLAKYRGWAPGPINDWSNGAQGWILWVALSLMISESLVSLGIMCWKIVSDRWNYRIQLVEDPSSVSERVPTWLWVSGLMISSLICIMIDSPIFGMSSWQPLIAIVIACLVSLISVRALGETDYNPVNGVGKISQIIFSLIAPGQITSNLVAGAIAEAGAIQAGDMMQDLKTGHILNASPRVQFWAQCIGSVVSVFTTVGAFELYRRSYQIPGPELSAPSHQIWIDMARLLNQGSSSLAPHVQWFIALFALLGFLLPILENQFSHSCWFLPSGVALAVGMYLPPYWVIPRAFGAVIMDGWLRYDRKNCGKFAIIMASGFILGEGLMSIVTATFHSFQLQPLSCFACTKELVLLGMNICSGC